MSAQIIYLLRILLP